MTKLNVPISIEIPPNALASDVKLIFDQLRHILVPEGAKIKLGVVRIVPVIDPAPTGGAVNEEPGQLAGVDQPVTVGADENALV